MVPSSKAPKMQANMRQTDFLHPAFRHNSSPPSSLFARPCSAQWAGWRQDGGGNNHQHHHRHHSKLIKPPRVYRKNLSCGKDLRKKENLLSSVLISVCCTHQILFFIQHIWLWLCSTFFCIFFALINWEGVVWCAGPDLNMLKIPPPCTPPSTPSCLLLFPSFCPPLLSLSVLSLLLFPLISRPHIIRSSLRD